MGRAADPASAGYWLLGPPEPARGDRRPRLVRRDGGIIRPDGRVWWATEQSRLAGAFAAEVGKALDRFPVVF